MLLLDRIDNDGVNNDSTGSNTIKNDRVEETTVSRTMVLIELLGNSQDVKQVIIPSIISLAVFL